MDWQVYYGPGGPGHDLNKQNRERAARGQPITQPCGQEPPLSVENKAILPHYYILTSEINGMGGRISVTAIDRYAKDELELNRQQRRFFRSRIFAFDTAFFEAREKQRKRDEEHKRQRNR